MEANEHQIQEGLTRERAFKRTQRRTHPPEQALTQSRARAYAGDQDEPPIRVSSGLRYLTQTSHMRSFHGKYWGKHVQERITPRFEQFGNIFLARILSPFTVERA